MLVFKIDNEGFFIGDAHLNKDEQVDFDYVTVKPPQNPTFFKPRWTGVEWVEGKTEDEFLEDTFLASLNPSNEELESAEFELKTIEVLLNLGVI